MKNVGPASQTGSERTPRSPYDRAPPDAARPAVPPFRPTTRCRPCRWRRFRRRAPPGATQASGLRRWSIHRRRCGRARKCPPSRARASWTNRPNFSRLRAAKSPGKSAVAFPAATGVGLVVMLLDTFFVPGDAMQNLPRCSKEPRTGTEISVRRCFLQLAAILVPAPRTPADLTALAAFIARAQRG